MHDPRGAEPARPRLRALAGGGVLSAVPPLSALALEGIPEVRAGDDLAAIVADALPDDLAAGDVICVAHKVVSKAEGRVRRLGEIEPGARARELAAAHAKDARVVQAVLDESATLLRAERGVLICVAHSGFVCANAGVDHSNASEPDELILLPREPDESARRLRAGIAALRGIHPGVLVTDSFGRAWRIGQTDVAIGAAGIAPLDDWRGRRDAHDRDLRATAIAVADAIAGAADLVRAKDAGQPAVLVRGLARFVTPADGPGAAALRRPTDEDLFR